MSNKLKDILKTGEEKFDLNAWNKINEQLNQTLPVKKHFFSSKTILLSCGVVLVSILLYITLVRPTKTSKTTLTKNEFQNIVTNKKDSQNKIDHQLDSNETPTTSNSKLVSTPKKEFSSGEIKTNGTNINQIIKNEDKIQEPLNQHSKISSEENNLNNFSNLEEELNFPTLKQQYCLGEKITISNTNTKNLILLNDAIETIVIPKNSIKTISIEKAGEYSLKFQSNAKNDKAKTFYVSEKKNLVINCSNEVIYENGIPYLEISSKDFNENSSWRTSKGMLIDQKELTKVRCFEKGNYTITLSQKDENACTTEEKIDFQIKEEYNLLAVNAFVPDDHNYKNRTFIPDALKYRNTNFQLIIIDPKDNHTVFQTSTVDLPWDGIDQMTGKMVDANKLFFWKVSLKNPEPREKSEYSGTIVRL